MMKFVAFLIASFCVLSLFCGLFFVGFLSLVGSEEPEYGLVIGAGCTLCLFISAWLDDSATRTA